MIGLRSSWSPDIHSTQPCRSITKATTSTGDESPNSPVNRIRLDEERDRRSRNGWEQWIRSDVSARLALDSFNGVFHHLNDAWRRKDRPNVMLVHYADLLHDLPGEMRRIAAQLGIDVASEQIDELAGHATFESMRSRSSDLAPDPVGVLIDKARFFRAGRSGAGTEALRSEDLADYNARAARAAPPDLLDWLHRG